MYYLFLGSEEKEFEQHVRKSQMIEVDDSLRGWNAEVKHLDINLPIWAVASKFCPTHRDIYLYFVKGIRTPPTPPLVEGRLLHETIAEVISSAKQFIYNCNGVSSGSTVHSHLIGIGKSKIMELVDNSNEDIRKTNISNEKLIMLKYNMLKLWNFESMQIAANVDQVLSRFPRIERDALVAKSVPVSVEHRFDGSRIGLSKRLSIDALRMPHSIVFDLKTGREQEFHDLTVAGYALALESEQRSPVNLGCIVYTDFSAHKPVPRITKRMHIVDNDLRRRFLEVLNKKLCLVAEQKDPGAPDGCPKMCSYYQHCHGSPSLSNFL